MLASYPDVEYESEFGAGSLAGATIRTIASISPNAGIPGALYKWVRINPVTERSLNLDVDGDHVKDSTTLLYFDGLHLNLNAAGGQALEVTSLAVLPDGHQEAVAICCCTHAIRAGISRSGDRARHLCGCHEFREPKRGVRNQRHRFLSSSQPAIRGERHERDFGFESHNGNGAGRKFPWRREQRRASCDGLRG